MGVDNTYCMVFVLGLVLFLAPMEQASAIFYIPTEITPEESTKAYLQKEISRLEQLRNEIYGSKHNPYDDIEIEEKKCEIKESHKNQIKEVLYDAPLKEEMNLPKLTRDYNKIYYLQRQIQSLTRTLTALFQKYYKARKYKLSTGEMRKYSEHVEEDDTWRALLVEKMINVGISYLKDHNLISSKAHERLTDEFVDMVNVEIARGTQLSLNQRVKGSAFK